MLIEGERIVAVAATGSDVAAAWSRRARVIDATGRYVIPGGVDAHTHMEMPFGGTAASDTFETGTRAAACGRHHDDRRLRRAAVGRVAARGLDTWHAKAEGSCAIDYALPHDPRRTSPTSR